MKPDPNRLIFGTNPLSSMQSRRSVFLLLEAVIATGIAHLDTARAYGQGYSERLVGEFLRAHGLRVRLTAKVGLGDAHTSPFPTWAALPINHWRKRFAGRSFPASAFLPHAVSRPPRLDTDTIRRSFDETLACLGVDTVDALLLHENLPANLDDRALSFFDGLKQDRVVRELGTGTNARVLDAYYEQINGFTVLQYEGGGQLNLPDLVSRFPDATHHRHGFLHGLGQDDPAGVLAAAQSAIPSGKVLFSTRSVVRLHQNMGFADPSTTLS